MRRTEPRRERNIEINPVYRSIHDMSKTFMVSGQIKYFQCIFLTVILSSMTKIENGNFGESFGKLKVASMGIVLLTTCDMMRNCVLGTLGWMLKLHEVVDLN